MSGTIFIEMLRRGWRSMFYWGLGLLVYAMYPFMMMPDGEGLAEYADLLESFDNSLVNAIGISDAASLGTPEGFVGYAYFGFLLLVLAIYGVIAGLNISANDEDSGAMDIFLSLPIPRWRVIVEKLLAYTVMIVVICLMGFVGLLIGNEISSQEIEISVGRYLEGSANLIPGTLFVMTFTALVATVVRRRSTAMAIAGVFVVFSYLLDAIGRAAGSETADAIREMTIFAHYDGTTVLQTGLVMGSVLLLLAAALVCGVGTVVFFERRDIAV